MKTEWLNFRLPTEERRARVEVEEREEATPTRNKRD